MLTRTFVHLPGIGPAREKKLWENEITDWNRLKAAAPEIVAGPRLELLLDSLALSENAFRAGNLRYFSKALPRDQVWRVLPGYIDQVAYLDIETTGLGFPPESSSTTIAFYHQGELYQEHEHEKKRLLIKKILKRCSIIVTFFGDAFDIPFLMREFNIEFDKAQIDLCFWLKRHGFSGGLKRVQKRFPWIPERHSMDINGFDAVKLWKLHLKGVEGALETLLTYNAEDTLVLEPLLVEAFNREIGKYPEFGLKPMEARTMPPLRTQVHPSVYAMLRGRH